MKEFNLLNKINVWILWLLFFKPKILFLESILDKNILIIII